LNAILLSIIFTPVDYHLQDKRLTRGYADVLIIPFGRFPSNPPNCFGALGGMG
jgi:hypothetical protein